MRNRKKVELQEYFDVFDITKDLNDNELISIGISKLGHRKKILKCIQML